MGAAAALTLSVLDRAVSYPSQFNSIPHTRAFSSSNHKLAVWKYSFRASSQGFKPVNNKKKDVVTEAESDDETKTKSTGKVVAPRVASNVQRGEKNAEVDNFEKRLDEIKRAAEEKKRLEERKLFGPIDYDSPPKPDTETVSLPVKVGIGLGVVIFGLIFAFGDLIPYGGSNVQKENVAGSGKKSTDESRRLLKEQLEGFEAILKIHPDDLDAIEGAAVTNAELGDFSKSEELLRRLVEARPTDVEALRLLGEVQSALGKPEESVATFRQAMQISPESITLLKGYVEALVSQGKQTEAVKELIDRRDRLTSSNRDPSSMKDQDGIVTVKQIGLLLGKTYAEWGHISDAVSVYDSLIKSYPEDFQGYLAKGILLKDQGQKGEADRMFIQARYLAPDKIKPVVDRYSKQ